jgi:hypothetical protein
LRALRALAAAPPPPALRGALAHDDGVLMTSTTRAGNS